MELLVVIAIIAALAALATPVTQRAIVKAREVRCDQQIAALALAIDSYKLEYGRLPTWISGGAPQTSDAGFYGQGNTGTPGRDFFECLMGQNTASFMNPRGKTFFEPQYTETGKNGYGASSFVPSQSGYLDPWGLPLYIYFDYDANGEVRHPMTGELIRREYIIISGGPNGELDFSSPNDDIYSWK
jgi:type II secretory pathway pseudopilin PulG